MSSSVEPRAWELVLDHLEKLLVSGEVKPGQRLPPERALAAELNVGRSSVREALRVLEAMGLLSSRTGSGPTAGAMIVSRPTGGLSVLMRLQVAANNFPVADVVRTRLLLETQVMETLAESKPKPDLGPAQQLLDAMDEDLLPHEFLLLDAQFHVSLAEAAGNTVIAAMMAGLREAIERYVVQGAPVDTWGDACRRLRIEHRALVEAILDGDTEAARKRISAHIRGYYAESLDGHSALDPSSGNSDASQPAG